MGFSRTPSISQTMRIILNKKMLQRTRRKKMVMKMQITEARESRKGSTNILCGVKMPKLKTIKRVNSNLTASKVLKQQETWPILEAPLVLQNGWRQKCVRFV
jgi:hypothetical protein